MSANRIVPDGTPCFAASHLGLFCLPMSNKKDTRLIWINRGVKHNFPFINIRKVPREVLKPEVFNLPEGPCEC